MSTVFGLPPATVTWNSKLISLQEPFWAHQGGENLKKMTWIQDLSHPRGFVPYGPTTHSEYGKHPPALHLTAAPPPNAMPTEKFSSRLLARVTES